MKLSDLLIYDKITIQGHDNPDADALASAYGLYLFFKDKGKEVRLVYGGRNKIQKSNLLLMLDLFKIPAEYINDLNTHFDGLLITADCQEGESNVTKFGYDELAIIDHHQPAPTCLAKPGMAEIHSDLGSCSTLVWDLLSDEGYDVNANILLATALYYGLMTDTGNFVEMKHPMDRDMLDYLIIDKSAVTRMVNSNISLDELEIAGVALIKYIYNAAHRYAIVHSKPCDPNILGLIADFLLQVDAIDICVVFNDTPDGYKFSTRSCIKEVNAGELIASLAEGIGNGGGHKDKAGGFILKAKLEEEHEGADIDAYIGGAMNNYFLTHEVIYAKDYDIDISKYKRYVKKPIVVGVVDPEDFWEKGTKITVRSLEGDMNTVIDGETYIMIGVVGEVYPIKKARLDKSYEYVDVPYECDVQYSPTIINRESGEVKELKPYIKACRSMETTYILARELDKTVKIFTTWDEQNYMLGKPHDYVAAREEDIKDIYVIVNDVFQKTYEEVK